MTVELTYVAYKRYKHVYKAAPRHAMNNKNFAHFYDHFKYPTGYEPGDAPRSTQLSQGIPIYQSIAVNENRWRKKVSNRSPTPRHDVKFVKLHKVDIHGSLANPAFKNTPGKSSDSLKSLQKIHMPSWGT